MKLGRATFETTPKKLLARSNQVFTYHNTEIYEWGQVKLFLSQRCIALS
jgi:hypothetical protein